MPRNGGRERGKKKNERERVCVSAFERARERERAMKRNFKHFFRRVKYLEPTSSFASAIAEFLSKSNLRKMRKRHLGENFEQNIDF